MPKNNKFADDGLVKDFAIHARGRITALENGANALDGSVDSLENVVALLGGRVSATELFENRISSLENNVRISNNPVHPPEGKGVTYWVGPGVVWPSGVFWSTDPDNSVAAADNSMWLVDEIAGTLDKVLCIIGEDSDQVSDLVRLVVQYVRQRTKAIKGIEP